MLPRVFTAEQVEEHRTAKSVWITFKGKVYDVTEFIADHPGGADLILQHGGTDCEEILGDEDSHTHSSVAYELLEDYCIGRLDEADLAKNRSSLSKHDEEVQKGVALGFAKKSDRFIDTTKPMLAQVFNAKWSQAFYVEQVHLPRQVKGSAPIFGGFLEILTLTPWWVIPMVYVPIVIWHCYYAVAYLDAATVTLPIYFSVGLFVWTFVEYFLHRFAFHVDDYLPNNQIAFTLHFLLHGIHHFLPMDKMRLVMPPALGLTLSIPVRLIVLQSFPVGINYIVIAGAYCGFMLYDLVH
ncbi:fatty acid alpha-hydroxylase, partial [Physocladia obscura]